MNTELRDRVIARLNGHHNGGLQKTAANHARGMIRDFIYKEAASLGASTVKLFPSGKHAVKGGLKDSLHTIGSWPRKNPLKAAGIGTGIAGTSGLATWLATRGGSDPRSQAEKNLTKAQGEAENYLTQQQSEEELFDDYGEAGGYTLGGAGLGGILGYLIGDKYGQGFTGGALGALGGGTAGVLLAYMRQKKRREEAEAMGQPIDKKQLRIQRKVDKAQADADARASNQTYSGPIGKSEVPSKKTTAAKHRQEGAQLRADSKK